MNQTLFNFHAVMEKSIDAEGMVKGFVSVNNPDRSDDLVPPESFNLSRYRANPQLLVDHKLWKTSDGNCVPAGSVVEAKTAKVADGEDPDRWAVLAEDGSKIDSISKLRTPDLRPGLRGLWVKARVTQPGVWDMVKAGQLNAFSWRGMAKLAKAVVGNVERVITKEIDLWECSLVYIPDQFAAMFEVSKGVRGGTDLMSKAPAELQTLPVCKLLFASKFFDQTTARDWLKSHGLVETDFTLKDGEFVSMQEGEDTFDAERMFSLSLGAGVTAVVGQQLECAKTLSKSEFVRLTKLFDGFTVVTTSDKPAEGDGTMSKKTAELAAAGAPSGTTDPQKSADTAATAAAPATPALTLVPPATPPTEQEMLKGKVVDMLANMAKEKQNRLQEVFKALSAFDKAIWDAPNEQPDLQNLVGELVSLLSGITVKSAESPEPMAVVTAISKATGDHLAGQLAPVLARIAEIPTVICKHLDEALASMKQDMQKNTDSKTPAASAAPAVSTPPAAPAPATVVATPEVMSFSKALATLNEGLSSLQGQVRTMTKTAVSPSRAANDEGKAPSADPADGDPKNACFGSRQWPFA